MKCDLHVSFSYDVYPIFTALMFYQFFLSFCDEVKSSASLKKLMTNLILKHYYSIICRKTLKSIYNGETRIKNFHGYTVLTWIANCPFPRIIQVVYRQECYYWVTYQSVQYQLNETRNTAHVSNAQLQSTIPRSPINCNGEVHVLLCETP